MLGTPGMGQFGIVGRDIDGEIVGRAEHDVVGQMRIVAQIERGDEFAIAGRADQEMDMGRPHAVPLLRVHHAADRTVHRDRIAARLDGAHDVEPVLVGVEHAAIVGTEDAFSWMS